MKKAKKTTSKKSQKVTYLLLGLAMVLLLGSAIGSTRAALSDSTEYFADIDVPWIGVSLYENGQMISSWEGKGEAKNGELLKNMLSEEEKLVLNKKYDEKLTVKNSGTIDEFVRVRIYKYWMKDDKKITTLSPDLIDLHLVNVGKPGDGTPWVIREPEGKSSEDISECTELYYTGILKPEEGKAKITDNPDRPTETEPFADTLRIDEQIATDVRIEQNGNIISTIYKYDGVEFHVDVEVDAVQTHNAKDAIKSAWGVDAESLGILGGWRE